MATPSLPCHVLSDAGFDVDPQCARPGSRPRRACRRPGGVICGRIAWLRDDKPQCIADKTPLVGKLVIEQMKQAEPGQWSGGRLYNPEDGRDYRGSVQLRSGSTLVVSGCVLFVCRTQVWRRADPARCPPVAPP